MLLVNIRILFRLRVRTNAFGGFSELSQGSSLLYIQGVLSHMRLRSISSHYWRAGSGLKVHELLRPKDNARIWFPSFEQPQLIHPNIIYNSHSAFPHLLSFHRVVSYFQNHLTFNPPSWVREQSLPTWGPWRTALFLSSINCLNKLLIIFMAVY